MGENRNRSVHCFDCPLCIAMGIQSHSIEVSSGTLLLIWERIDAGEYGIGSIAPCYE